MKTNRCLSVLCLTAVVSAVLGCGVVSGQTSMHQNNTTSTVYSTNAANDYMYREMYDTMRRNNQIQQQMINNSIRSASAGRRGGVPVGDPQAVAVWKVGRARIDAGKASTKFASFTAGQRAPFLKRADYSIKSLVGLFGEAEGWRKIEQMQKEVVAYGYDPNDYVDMTLYSVAVIYEADFGTFPSAPVMEKWRALLKASTLKEELLQGSAESFAMQSYRALAGAALARYWQEKVEHLTNAAEIEKVVGGITGLEKLFTGHTGVDIYAFAGEQGGERQLKKDATFRRENRELARGWYETEYAAKFGRTDLDYAALLKEFDGIVTGMGGATNDGADGELAAAALVYEVYLDSIKASYQLNENHLRDLREMIARNFAQPYWSEAADIWRQRNYEQIGSRGMFINKAYFSAKTPQQKKALADEALNVLKIVFRNHGFERHKITEEGIFPR